MYLLVVLLLVLYLQVILSDARDKAVLKASNDKEGGEDNVGEEGDEVGQLPIRLWINTILGDFGQLILAIFAS